MNIRNLVAGSALAGALSLLPAAAHATPEAPFSAPNYYGITGAILTPDANVLPNMCVNLGGHYFVGRTISPERDDLRGLGLGGDRLGLRCPDTSVVFGNIGIGNRLEIGGAYRQVWDRDVQGGGIPNRAMLNAKLNVTPTNFPLQVAGGVQDATNHLQRTVYAVGTIQPGRLVKGVSALRGLSVSGGWRWVSETDEDSGFRNDDFGAPFVNGTIPVGKYVQLLGEWNPEQDLERNAFICVGGTVNAGARIHLPMFKGIVLDVAGIGLDHDPTLAGGLSYQMCFGKKHHKKSEEPGCDEKGEEKGESKGEKKLGLVPSKALGLAAHLNSVN